MLGSLQIHRLQLSSAISRIQSSFLLSTTLPLYHLFDYFLSLHVH